MQLPFVLWLHVTKNWHLFRYLVKTSRAIQRRCPTLAVPARGLSLVALVFVSHSRYDKEIRVFLDKLFLIMDLSLI